jgi:hypothetical protein
MRIERLASGVREPGEAQRGLSAGQLRRVEIL